MINRLYLFILVVTKITMPSFASVDGSKYCLANVVAPPNGVCPSISIRNLDNFNQLRNCTVIEGNLFITVDATNSQNGIYAIEDLSFPELREITDHLIVYRVNKLTSFKKLFPNLRVIRGQHLFDVYSLVIYENNDLQEIGLINLDVIGRGSVRISNNFKLCYADTINWTQLGVEELVYIYDNSKQPCPVCRSNCEPRNCWSYDQCQKGFTCSCKANQGCMANGACCHEYCLGGCKGPTAEDCYSCKYVSFNNSCLSECPPATYRYKGRRCLTDRECLSLPYQSGKAPMLLVGEKGEPSQCVFYCPQNYTIRELKEKNYNECVKCTGFCHKECSGLEVQSAEDALNLQGCTKISGDLTIKILRSTSKVVEELTKGLGNIIEITQSFAVRQSYALKTLYFLKSLQYIGTEIPKDSTKSDEFTLLDNHNLYDLFPEEQMKKMKIKHGRLVIHNNRNLCLYKIQDFVSHLNLTFNPDGISTMTNGDQRPCMKEFLNISVTVYSHTSVVLRWDKYKADVRQLLTYIMNYKEIYSRKTKIYSKFHAIVKFNIKIKLKSPDPSEPRDLTAVAESPYELKIKWKPPIKTNGVIKYYKVYYHKLEFDEKIYCQRDYCVENFSSPKLRLTSRLEEEITLEDLPIGCCRCPMTQEQLTTESQKRQVEVHFEDFLHKNIYCKRYDKLPEEVDNTLAHLSIDFLVEHSDSKLLWQELTNSGYNETHLNETLVVDTLEGEPTTIIQGISNYSNPYPTIMEVEVYNATEVTLTNLDHFSEYSIEVIACHETNTNISNGAKYCSIRAITLGITQPNWRQDKINESSIEVEVETNYTGRVFIKWDSPPNPNGLIMSYYIVYKKANQENAVGTQLCLTRQEYLKNHGYRMKLDDYGNFTFKIGTLSLAGNKTFTSEKFFILPKPPGPDDSNLLLIVGLVVGICCAIMIVGIAVVLYYRQKILPTGTTVISPNANYVPSEHVYNLDEWEVSRDKIRLIRELGQGSFGMVYEGIAKGLRDDDPEEEIPVAVKTVNERANFTDTQEFLNEATIMKAFHCHHVVKLLGVVSRAHPYYVVMELMPLGDLKTYLRQLRPDEEHPFATPPTLLEILQMTGEIADGMAYLADKKFVHRDLAARNCMVAGDRTVKVGDFGMTRDVYETDYYRKGGKGMLPVRWMAPESLKDGVFSSMSDCWSFGVVLWEMVTLAAQPYQGLSNEEVVRFVTDGHVMDIPENCPEEMAFLMRLCWERRPNKRPTFKAVIKFLLPKLKSSFEKVSFYYSSGSDTHDGAGPGNIELFEGTLELIERREDATSINSLCIEGAAAPKQSSLPQSNAEGNSQFGITETVFQFDDELVPLGYMDNEDDEEDCFISEFGDDVDDSSQPFMPESYTSSVNPRQPLSHQSHHSNGSEASLHNSGLIEMKPLIKKEKSHGSPSPKQTIIPRPVEYLDHEPPTLEMKPDPRNSLPQNNPFSTSTADPLRLGPHNTIASSNLPGGLVSRPNLRLPVLSPPPTTGFKIVSQHNSGDNTDAGRQDKPPSGQPIVTHPAAPLANLVHFENELESPQATGLSLPDQHYSSTPSAIATTNSSDGSKESTKSSESFSLRNGLTNGHIYLPPSDRHRTAPC
uniref:Tyrosine-protein kinase receptor n=1 Tax=Biomphalaria glabrata TaxID=6526 RepID=A0A2C9K623_BIOGL